MKVNKTIYVIQLDNPFILTNLPHEGYGFELNILMQGKTAVVFASVGGTHEAWSQKG